MIGPLILWIAVVDGGHARFVRRDGHNRLHTAQALGSSTVHLRSRDLGSDRPGRAFESGSSARHAVGERHDLHTMEKQRFARLVAEHLNTASDAGAFDELLIAAPARVLHELREALDAPTKAKLIGTVDKDLVKVPDHELWPHVRAWTRTPQAETAEL